MNPAVLADRIKQYRFYHTIPLTDEISTQGAQDPAVVRIWDIVLKALRSVDVSDKRFLDIGCRDGLFSFDAERRGAREVVGIDNDLSLGAVELLIPYFGSKVRMHAMNLYDLTPKSFGVFDVVCFAGVLYHLRYPIWGLKLIRDVLVDGGTLILETAIYIDDNKRAMLNCPIGRECPGDDPTNCANFNLKGLVDTLYSLGITVDSGEYLWERGLVRSESSRPGVEVRPYEFDEAFYRREHGDIDEAIRSHYWKQSCYYHYMLHGRAEGRIAQLLDGTIIRPDTEIAFEDANYNRAVLVCRKDQSVLNAYVQNYLEGTHAVHSGVTAADQPYGAWSEFPRPKPLERVSLFN